MTRALPLTYSQSYIVIPPREVTAKMYTWLYTPSAYSTYIWVHLCAVTGDDACSFVGFFFFLIKHREMVFFFLIALFIFLSIRRVSEIHYKIRHFPIIIIYDFINNSYTLQYYLYVIYYTFYIITAMPIFHIYYAQK